MDGCIDMKIRIRDLMRRKIEVWMEKLSGRVCIKMYIAIEDVEKPVLISADVGLVSVLVRRWVMTRAEGWGLLNSWYVIKR